MIELIVSRIKQIYGKERNFCKEHGYNPTNFPKLKRTVANKIDWLNKFLEPLGLKIEIKDK
ncbi:hypothetical protein KAR91_70675 [Candidatus Pacearchaeota archaeon]|nr:hypothetical protein [Candidatus Pacearchaeota archaeon]